MITLMLTWFNSLWGSMEQDIAFALIGGGIILFAQLLNAGIGVWKNIGIKEKDFDPMRFVVSLLKEVGLTVLLIGGVALTYMVANIASLSILPGFDVGDVPTAALLLAYGSEVIKKSKNIWDNLMFIMTGQELTQTIEIEVPEDLLD